MPFYSWHEIPKDLIPGTTLPAGMSRQAIVGGNAMVCLHEAFPNLKCKPHRHDAEQFTIVLKGQMRFVIANETRIIGPDEVAHIPSGIEHSIESLDEYVLVLDIFSPNRPDILERLAEMHKSQS